MIVDQLVTMSIQYLLIATFLLWAAPLVSSLSLHPDRLPIREHRIFYQIMHPISSWILLLKFSILTKYCLVLGLSSGTSFYWSPNYKKFGLAKVWYFITQNVYSVTKNGAKFCCLNTYSSFVVITTFRNPNHMKKTLQCFASYTNLSQLY